MAYRFFVYCRNNNNNQHYNYEALYTHKRSAVGGMERSGRSTRTIPLATHQP